MHKAGVTLQLLHHEYLEKNPGGYGYTAFCESYRQWRRNHKLAMRQEHRAGDKLFVNYAGMRPSIVDRATGERVAVELFVAVLGASNYTYADATRTQQVPDWIASHVCAGLERSDGSVGDSYDNALAESINGLYKTEVIRRSGPWRNVDEVEYATLVWVDWFNIRHRSNRSGTCHPRSSKRRTINNRVRRWLPDSRHRASGDPRGGSGTYQTTTRACYLRRAFARSVSILARQLAR